MKLLFRQRFFSWFDSYDIWNEAGETVYTVRGQLSWGHCLKIFDAQNHAIGTVRERVLSFLPRFELYLGDRYLGCVRKELSFSRPHYRLDCADWQVTGDFFEWDYTICHPNGISVATVSKQLFRWTDTYAIDVVNPQDALTVLMFVLAMDAEKCSRS